MTFLSMPSRRNIVPARASLFACIYFNFMRAARTYGAWIMLKQNAPEVIIENAEAFDVDPVVVFDC
jgi:hypothetical protein